ncbi:MAG: glycosyltransferase family 2 protein [Candidatus Woesearchaeota archaeon]
MEGITAIIPAYNEAGTIGPVLDVVAKAIPQVIVVDDGSTDSTFEVVQERMRKYKNLLLVRHRTNRGKSVAVKTALNYVNTPYALFLDADLVGLKNQHIVQFKKMANNGHLMVVGLRDRAGVIGQLFMRCFPIGGERLVKTSLVKALSKDKLWKAYNMESLMNWFVRGHSRIHFLKLKGLNHVPKAYKRGFLKGLFSFMRQFLVSAPFVFFALRLRPKRKIIFD